MLYRLSSFVVVTLTAMTLSLSLLVVVVRGDDIQLQTLDAEKHSSSSAVMTMMTKAKTYSSSSSSTQSSNKYKATDWKSLPLFDLNPDDRRRELHVMQHLLAAGYTYYTRPLTGDNETLEVRLRVSLIKIQNLWERTDVKTEALEATMRMQFNWCDDNLSWDPDHFGGVDNVIIPGDRLWIPDIQIINALDDVYMLTRDRRFDFKLHSDGCVWWYPTGTTLTRCQLDLSYFPFDIQECPIIFESAMYPIEFLNLTMRYDKKAVSLKTFTENGQWELLSAAAVPKLNYVSRSTAFSRVEVVLVLGRKTLYYQMNVLCPCGMLSALQVLTFLLPIGSEDRISQSTTVLLSFVVFQSAAVEELPRTSNSVPLLCLYIDFLTGISVVTVTNAIFSVYLLKTTAQNRQFKNSSLLRGIRKSIVRKLKRKAAIHKPGDSIAELAINGNKVSVGISVSENEIFDEDSLDEESNVKPRPSTQKMAAPSNRSNGTLLVTPSTTNNHFDQIYSNYPAFIATTNRLSQLPVPTDSRTRRRDLKLQTIAITVDKLAFFIAVVSSALVPFYMFYVLPPSRGIPLNSQ